jgi:hypothetical protein
MENNFVPYEQALALKKLGFDEPCFATYFSVGAWQIDCTEGGLNLKNKTPSEYSILAPLFQQAFKWFREKYNLHYHIATSNKGYVISVKGISIESFEWEKYKTYEEAELECLKKLIEIAQNKNEPKETD